MDDRHGPFSSPTFIFILAAASLIIYANSLTGEFISDDVSSIVRNPYILRPLLAWSDPARLLNSFNYLLAGPATFIYHLTNVILHSLNSVLVFLVLRRFFGQAASFWGALVFALHPAHAEAVAWVSGRNYLISALFVLTVYLCYRAATRENRLGCLSYAAALLLFAYFLVSYFVYAALCALFLVVCEAAASTLRRNWKAWLPFLLLVLARLIMARGEIAWRADFVSAGAPCRLAGGNVVYNIAFSLFSNLWLLFFPLRLRLYHEPMTISPAVLGLYVLLFALAIPALVLAFRKEKALFFGSAVFIVFLLPTYSPVKVCAAVAERYLYLPAIILSTLFAWLYGHYASRGSVARRLVILSLTALAFSYGLRTILRNNDWRSAGSFWRAEVRASYDNPLAHIQMAEVLRREGDYTGSLRSLEQAARLDAENAYAWHSKGLLLAETGRQAQAVDAFKQAIRLKPDFSEAYFNLAVTSAKMGDYTAGLASYEKAISINPDFIEAYINLAELYSQNGDMQKAIDLYNKVLAIDGRQALAHNNLAVAYYRQGAFGLAVRHCDLALELGYSVSPEFLKLLSPYRQKDKGEDR